MNIEQVSLSLSFSFSLPPLLLFFSQLLPLFLTILQCVKEGYLTKLEEQKHEGCHVQGYLKVNRVAGNFNVVPGKFFQQNARFVLDNSMYGQCTFHLPFLLSYSPHFSFLSDSVLQPPSTSPIASTTFPSASTIPA